ncbi:MAG: hypothetical protein M3R43_04320 [Acidobacteriota bacterium]|nr:hypothetical protein [Acidobacteriota bacterium]
MPPRTVVDKNVFLNIPYDQPFEKLYLAYIVGLIQLGLTPFVTLAIPGGNARLDRIFALIQSCRFSIHDLSRVQISATPPATPRFNMPFELGLAVAWSKLHPERHTYIPFETMNRRAQKSLSDMAGSDFNIHDGTPMGVMRELCSAFVNQRNRPDVPTMMRRYAIVQDAVPLIIQRAGAKSIYEARVFAELVFAASESLQSAP